MDDWQTTIKGYSAMVADAIADNEISNDSQFRVPQWIGSAVHVTDWIEDHSFHHADLNDNDNDNTNDEWTFARRFSSERSREQLMVATHRRDEISAIVFWTNDDNYIVVGCSRGHPFVHSCDGFMYTWTENDSNNHHSLVLDRNVTPSVYACLLVQKAGDYALLP